ncbi:hypothetical protein F5Y19DRAFT_456340 [Xylariaceae sp. FL1651]|nr:hypothetical protein F5Y19DRAFT_456340 [Xylariaceae sp. FL1651]
MDERVHLGLWTNWSRGPILGHTFTTTKATGNLIIAFTAVFIGLVSTRLWKIISFILHWYYSTPVSRDTIHHQRQVIIRNTITPESSLFAALQLCWAWKRSVFRSRRLFALLPLILLSSSCLAFFTVAGGYSSTISTTVGDQVLLKGDKCGVVAALSTAGINGSRLAFENAAIELNKAVDYAQQCYSSDTPGTVECNKFVTQALPIAVANFNASCPFENNLCRSPYSNVLLDTGPLDSNDYFGINAPSDHRFTYRYVVQCAPLETNGFTSLANVSGKLWTRYHYGTAVAGGTDNTTKYDFSYEIENTEAQYTFAGVNGQVGRNLRLSTLSSYTYQRAPMTESTVYIPIPGLAPPDGDLVLIFLSGQGVLFSERLDDLWYQATSNGTNIEVANVPGSSRTFRPSEPASPLGCVEQHQWCNSAYPDDQGCGPLASNYDAIYGAAPKFDLTSADLDPERPISNTEPGARLIWNLITLFQYPSKLNNLLIYLGSKSLASQSHLISGVVFGTLPTNQWQLDVQLWFQTMLSTFQAAFTSTASGPSSAKFEDIEIRPINWHEQHLCNSQKIRSTAYTSFSLLGLVVTYILGGLMILVSFIFEPVLGCVDRTWKRKYARLEWSANSSLQLQRLAHEELSMAKWSNCTRPVPVTDTDAVLSSLDISDVNHPVLAFSNYTVDLGRRQEKAAEAKDISGARICPIMATQ